MDIVAILFSVISEMFSLILSDFTTLSEAVLKSSELRWHARLYAINLQQRLG